MQERETDTAHLTPIFLTGLGVYFLLGNWEWPITELPAPQEAVLGLLCPPRQESLCAQDAAVRDQVSDSTISSFNHMAPLWDTKFRSNLSQAAPGFFAVF